MLLFILLLFIQVQGYMIVIIENSSEATLSQQLDFSDSSVFTLNSWDPLAIIEVYPDLLIILNPLSIAFPQIIKFSQEFQIPAIINQSGQNQPWVFFTQPPAECLENSLLAGFEFLSIHQPGIIFSFSEKKIGLIQKLQQSSKGTLSILEQNETQEKISEMVAKFFKSKGIKNYFVEAVGEACNFVELVVEELKLEKKWNMVLYSEECAHWITRNGSLAIVYSDLVSVKTDLEYFSILVYKYYQEIQGKMLSRYEISLKFNQVSKPCKYLLVNIQNSSKVVVAEIIDGNVSPLNQIEYFEGVNNREIVSRPPVQFSAYTGIKNPPGYPDVVENSRYQQGNYFAIDQINTKHTLLQDFNLQIFDDINCGVTIFDYNFSKDCFLNISKKLGVAYIPSFYASTLIPVNNQWPKIGISTPIVAGIGASAVLSNSSEYPMFTRMVSSLNYVTMLFGKFFYIMEWQKIVVFYTNESFGSTVYDIILENSFEGGYEIMNDEQFREINFSLVPYKLENYKDNIKNAIDTECNIFVLCMSDPAPYFWMEVLYDYGIRRGDITIIISTITGPDAISIYTGDIKKREELLYGSFTIYNAGWVGEYGAQIQSKVYQQYNYSWMCSFYIDATYSIAHSADLLIIQGKDYEDPEIFIKAQRQVRFTGASGLVSLDTTSNDRNLNFFNVYNIYKNETTNLWVGEAVALISPLSSVYYTVLNSFVWPGGAKPTDVKVKYMGCNITVESVQPAKQSEFLQFSITLGLLGTTMLVTLFVARLRKIRVITMLDAQVNVKFSDYLSCFYVGIEPLQLISLGPNAGFNQFIQNISQFFSLNCVTIFKLRNIAYWGIFYSFLMVGYCWIGLVVVTSTFLLSLCGKYATRIYRFKVFIVPVMTDYLFIPIVTGSLTVFSCNYAEGPYILNAFLDYDCSISCWSGSHLALSVFTGLLILIYAPLAIHTKYLSEEHSETSNIKTSEHYDILKSVIFLMIISFKQFFQNMTGNLFSFYYFALMLCLFIYVLMKKTFNFDRANLWNKVAYVVVLWNTFVIILSEFFSLADYFFVCLQFLGITVIVMVGIKKHLSLPASLLVMGHGRTVVDMFLFQFGKKGYENTIKVSEKKTFGLNSTFRVDLF